LTTHWPAVTAALDLCTAVCAGFNALYFLDMLLSTRVLSAARATAILVLALISLAMMLEAVSLLSLAAAARPVPAGTLEWALVRLLPAVSSAGLTIVVARRIVER
jgi:hypothetical protein